MLRFASSLRSVLRLKNAAALAVLAFAATTSLAPAQALRPPKLPAGCEALEVPEGNEVSYRAFAVGVQIYRWDDVAQRWSFVAPSALLLANSHSILPVGFHFAGPTWTNLSGSSSVVGSVQVICPVDPTAIPWLKLSAVSSQGPGPFEGTTFIQRVSTTGGRAPSRTGTAGEEVRIPYTAEYYFYRAI